MKSWRIGHVRAHQDLGQTPMSFSQRPRRQARDHDLADSVVVRLDAHAGRRCLAQQPLFLERDELVAAVATQGTSSGGDA